MAFTDNTIHVCKFCGERTTGLLCKGCKTKEQRKDKIQQQLEIDSENMRRKDRTIEHKIFGFNRDTLMEFYGVK